MRCAFASLLAAIPLGVAGCKAPHPPLETVVSMEQVVAEYNANATRIPRLWARAEVSFKKDAAGLPMNLDGLLVLQKSPDRLGPQDFFLKLKEAGQELGRIGVSMADHAYYLWLRAGDQQQCLWGRLSLAGAPGIEGLPIDPTQLQSVLAICEMPPSQTDPPFVGQTVSFDPCAYVLTYVDRQPVTGRLLFKRELYFVWSETEPRRPFLLRLLDGRGRPVLKARMQNYKPVQLEDVEDDGPPPVMPTDIRITWRQTGAELHLKLSSMTTADKVDPVAYRFWQWLPPGLRDRARQVDEGLAAPKPATKGACEK
jgi:hypothetical protein